MKIDTLTKVEWFIRVRTFYGKVMNLDVFILATHILLEQPHCNVIAKKTKGKQYDMGCECGKRKVDAHAEQDCELSAKLEESGPIDHDKYHRIVGGCNAGHTPWYTLFILTENNVKCGGALINKFWILSAAHCFCNEEYMNCNKVKNKWVPDYDITKIKVGASIVKSCRKVSMSYSDFHWSRQPVCAAKWPSFKRIITSVDEQLLPSWNNHPLQILHERNQEQNNVCSKRSTINLSIINILCTSLSDYDIALVRINYPVQDYESGAYNVARKIHKSSTINNH